MGEDNPHSGDPRHALCPYPPGCAGSRLQDRILDVSLGDYLRRYDRVNLCAGKWSAPEARLRAAGLVSDGALLVLLGAKVAAAFGLDHEPFTVAGLRGAVVVQLPHPSGRCRVWNDPASYGRARAVLRAAGILPPGSA